MRQRSVVGGLVVLVGLSIGVLAQPLDVAVGTWKLNVAKSTSSPDPQPKSLTVKIERVTGGALKTTFDGVDAQGRATHSESVSKWDGKEVPVQAVRPPTTGVITVTSSRMLKK